MRLNQFIAQATGLSRRGADALISTGKVRVNSTQAVLGITVKLSDIVELEGKVLSLPKTLTTIIFHKPAGYVTSREGQGSKTIYELLPQEFHNLKPIGRLDKDTSGLLLLTDDGALAQQLTHPRYEKEKVYEVLLNRTLSDKDAGKLMDGVPLEDGISRFLSCATLAPNCLRVCLSEGRNRQIRRTFEALGYKVVGLHRTKFGDYQLADLEPGKFTTT